MCADIVERYPLNRCPFYRLERKKDLARLLSISSCELMALQRDKEALTVRRSTEINGKPRELKYPRGKLRRVHDRLRRLLTRCELPGYVYSPRRSRSPIANALEHVGGTVVEKLDVRQFYPSTTFKHVFDFFRYQLEMSADAAYILADLTTVDGALCFGSPVSPILAVLVHQDIFDPIAKLAAEQGFRLTVWVDDVTISGGRRPFHLVSRLRKQITRKGLRYHKSGWFSGGRAGEVTGVRLRAHKLDAPPRVHLKVRDLLRTVRKDGDPMMRQNAIQRLTGLTHHQLAIAKAGGRPTARLEARLRWLSNLSRSLATLPVMTMPESGALATPSNTTASTDPF